MRHAASPEAPPEIAPPDGWLPPHVQQVADQAMRAWCTTPGPRWHEAAAVLICSSGRVRDGLAALPLLAELDALHQPVAWAAGSDVVVCSCGTGAFDACPSARVLRAAA